MTHTPWNHDKAGNDADQWLIYDANGRTIGLSYHGEDNARLFAAAPDLLTALEKAANDLDTTADYVADTGQTGTADGIRNDAKAAHAAIARAKEG